MDELLTQIQEIQKHLYGGYKTEEETNVDWLEVRSKCSNFKIIIIFFKFF